MSTSTLTSKGQTTIPRDIRRYLKLNTGDRLEFIVQGNGQVLLMPATVNVTELQGILPQPNKTVSLNAMDRVVREQGKEQCKE